MSRFADQASIVLLAQFRMYRNMLGKRGKATAVANLVISGLWYAFAVFVAVLVSGYLSTVESQDELASSVQYLLLAILAYWQITPILTVSFGLALDVKRLLIFPIRPNQFFLLDLVLCLPTSIEPLIVLTGVFIGLLRNPAAPLGYALLAIPLFLCINLCLGVTFRALVTKMSTLRWWREALIFIAVMLALTPQWLMLTDDHASWIGALSLVSGAIWLPWAAAGNLSAGLQVWPSLFVLLVWAAVALAAGRGLFHHFLSAESGPARSASASAPHSLVRRRGFADLRSAIAYLLAKPFPEPVASLVEKEFLTYSRSPRFLTVFVMGFTFGIVVFLPIALGSSEQPGFVAQNFLTVVTAYAILLMSETAFWNVFGLDRKAVQTYLFVPVRLQHVFIAKNIVAFAIVCFQVILIAIVCSAIGVPVTLGGVAEAVVAAVVLAINMFAVGNQSSVRYPAGVNPDESWATANKAKFRLVLMLLFPLISLPTSVAYLARFAFGSDWGFYAGMAVAAMIAISFYLVSLDSSIEYARNHRENLADLLGTTDSAV